MSAPIDFKKLREPFPETDIEWRIGSSGKNQSGIWIQVLAYVTNRAVQDRLDAVCGPGNWRNEFVEWHGQEQLCGIAIRVDGEWITKWDGAQQTKTEGTKGGLSGAMKRAASQWGIGRYLYNLPSPNWGNISDQGNERGKVKYKEKPSDRDFKEAWVNWDPPRLAQWALPGGSGKPGVASPPPAGKASGDPPRGKWGSDKQPQGNGTQQPAVHDANEVAATRTAIDDAPDDFNALWDLAAKVAAEVDEGTFTNDNGHELQGLLNLKFLPLIAPRIDSTLAENCDGLIRWIVGRRFSTRDTGDLIKLVKKHKEQLAAPAT